MLKVTLALALIVAAATAAYVQPVKRHEADKTFLMKEKTLLQLLSHVHQQSMFPEHMDIAKTYKIEENMDKYLNQELVQDFVKFYKTDKMMKRGEIFTVFNKKQLEQAIKLFNVFYFAKDFETFYKTAAWARSKVNEGMFVYAFSVAVLHREDTKYLILPPPYEVYPHLFLKNDIIQKAYEVKMRGNKIDKKVVVIDATDKAMTFDTNKEQRISYFTEDIGLNTFNMYYHLEYPFWMKPEIYNIKFDRRGELFHYMNKQLLNRYQLERMINNLNEMEMFTLNKQEPMVGYAPNLRYKNGKDMPVRPDAMKLRQLDVEYLELVQDFERRIRDAIDMGYVYDKEGKKYSMRDEMGFDILGRMIEKIYDNVQPEYYGTLYNTLLTLVGHIVDPLLKHELAPSTMMNYETMLRDPMYYKLMARIDKLFLRYKKHLPKYTKEQLIMPGVKIENMEVDKFVTYFDYFDTDMTNAIDVSSIDDDDVLEIRARQYRLNHKPYTMRFDVTSDKEINVMARIFLTPKMNMNMKEMSTEEKMKMMIELDKFPVKLHAGKNTFERKSLDIMSPMNEKITYRDLIKKVDDALQGKSTMYIDEYMRHCAYPHRLLLPKGKPYGVTYQMIVMFTPIEDKTMEQYDMNNMMMCGMVQNMMYPDKYPMGFPFDREIKETEFDNLPNMFVKNVMIYHKNVEEMNKTQQPEIMEDKMWMNMEDMKN